MAKERPFEGGWLSREAIIIIMKILGTTLGTNNKVYTYSPNQLVRPGEQCSERRNL